MNAHACRGKVRLASRALARRAKQRAGGSGLRLHAYFCRACHGYHLGNTIGGPRHTPYKRERGSYADSDV